MGENLEEIEILRKDYFTTIKNQIGIIESDAYEVFGHFPSTAKEREYIIHLVAKYLLIMEKKAYEDFKFILDSSETKMSLATLKLYQQYAEAINGSYSFEQRKEIETEVGEEAFTILERMIFLYNAFDFSLEDWVTTTFIAIHIKIMGVLIAKRISNRIDQNPDDKTIFDWKQAFPFDGFFSKYGFYGKRTEEIDKAIVKLLQKDAQRGVIEEDRSQYPRNLYNLKNIKPGEVSKTTFKDHEKVSLFATKWFQIISNEITDDEAFQQLIEGTLRKFLKKRSYDRVTNDLTDERLQKRGGKSLAQIGKEIRVKRETMDLTQKGLATKTGLSIKFINQIEEGKRTRLAETALRNIANALEVDLDKLIGGKIIVHTDFQEYLKNVADDTVKSIQVTFADGFEDDLESVICNNMTIEELKKNYPPLSDHYRVLEALFDADFTTSTRDRGEKRLLNKSQLARKAKVSRKRLDKILEDFRNDIKIEYPH